MKQNRVYKSPQNNSWFSRPKKKVKQNEINAVNKAVDIEDKSERVG